MNFVPLIFAAILSQLSQPVMLNSSNTDVSFAVDSTWHTIRGAVGNVEGKLWLEEPDNFRSARVRVAIPVRSFDTDNSRRDSRMREVMAEPQFPEVVFEGGYAGECDFAALAPGAECSAVLKGALTIRGVQKPSTVRLRISRAEHELVFQGAADLDWRDFQVEDPSILVAKLDPTVHVVINVRLPE